jgi:hypothetical protein
MTGTTSSRRQRRSMIYAKEERLHIRHVTAEHYSLQPIATLFMRGIFLLPLPRGLPKAWIRTNSAMRLQTSRFNTPAEIGGWKHITE